MDPNACLTRWRNAVARGDKAEARAARADLHDWLVRGGFAPAWQNDNEKDFFMGHLQAALGK
jgi:hypothetical protein